MTSDPAVAVNTDGRIEVFILGGDSALWQIEQSSAGNPFGSFTSLGGSLTGNPAVAVNANGNLEAFARGVDGSLWHTIQVSADSPQWTGFASLGGFITSDPSVAVNTDGRVEAFARGGDNALWHIWQSTAGGAWGQWYTLGGTLSGGVTPALNTDGILAAFANYADNSLWYMAQTSPGNWSAPPSNSPLSILSAASRAATNQATAESAAVAPTPTPTGAGSTGQAAPSVETAASNAPSLGLHCTPGVITAGSTVTCELAVTASAQPVPVTLTSNSAQVLVPPVVTTARESIQPAVSGPEQCGFRTAVGRDRGHVWHPDGSGYDSLDGALRSCRNGSEEPDGKGRGANLVPGERGRCR